MGVFNNILGGGKGYQCNKNAEGEPPTCMIFKVKGDQKIASGTVLNLQVDPSTCEVSMGGNSNTILDEDREAVKQMMNDLKSQCRRGIA